MCRLGSCYFGIGYLPVCEFEECVEGRLELHKHAVEGIDGRQRTLGILSHLLPVSKGCFIFLEILEELDTLSSCPSVHLCN